MWVWILATVVLIGCFVIAYRLLISSFHAISGDKRNVFFESLPGSDMNERIETSQTFLSKLRSLEDKSEYYESQIEKINKKLDRLLADTKPAFLHQESNADNSSSQQNNDKEDWKELFYEENEKKEKLENELDKAQGEIEKLKEKLRQQEMATLETATKKEVESQNVKEYRVTMETAPEQEEAPATVQGKQPLIPVTPEGLQTESPASELSLRDENNRFRFKINELTIRNSILKEKIKQFEQLFPGLSVENRRDVLNELEESEKKREEMARQIEELTQFKTNNEVNLSSIHTLKKENENYRNQLSALIARHTDTEAEVLRLRRIDEKLAKYKEENKMLLDVLEKMIGRSKSENIS